MVWHAAAIDAEQTGVIGRIGVASVAFLGRAFEYTVFVTCLAFNLGVRSGERECRQAVIEADILPAIGRMAALAVLSEAPLMSIIAGVAGGTVLRCALEHAVQMARLACDLGVRSGKWESRQAVIEAGVLPAIGHVAALAVLTEASLVSIISDMARGAVLRSPSQVLERARSGMAG